ncbi:DUF1294 domain-containing protein [Vibrio profundi]|uniref:DUF1294 domain-containing protein n=1 Tax=Vibrio profundi TaxID=1774960 RepID=UPI003736C468
MVKGKITEWHDSKGYGFISSLENGQRMFFHISSVTTRNHRPKVDDLVSYSTKRDSKGRHNAIDIVITNATLVSFNLVLALSFLVLVCASSFVLNGYPALIIVYVFMSLLTYIRYAVDKQAAIEKKFRVPESSLHIFSLLGGWPGALFAQNQLKHKSRKQPFKTILWLTIIVNSGAYFWLLTPSGHSVVEQTLHRLLDMAQFNAAISAFT